MDTITRAALRDHLAQATEALSHANRVPVEHALPFLTEAYDQLGAAVMLDPNNKLVDPAADTIEHHPETLAALRDAERYRLLKRGQHWSTVNGIGDTLRGEDLDRAIDAVVQPPKGGD